MTELEKGMRRLSWAEAHMPVLREIRERLKKERPLKGLKVGMALHVEAKTGILALTLAAAGAEVRLASCNPLSTDDSVAIALKEGHGMKVYAKKWQSQAEYYDSLNEVLDMAPDLIIDDGADLIAILHTARTDLLKNVRGANEETTTGVVRLRSLAAAGKLKFPVIAVNDAKMKFLFDNRYGTGQSVFDGWMNSTNLLVAGKRLAVAGYGWCGKGIAMRAKGLGAIVIVTEVDPVRAIEARLDGFEVMRMADAVKDADAVITATGCNAILAAEHFKAMKSGCILGNAGHFDNEIDKKALESMAAKKERVREFVDEYTLKDGRRICLIAEGRLMNLAAGQGHPAEIMDTSFATQALAIEYLAKNWKTMENIVHTVPEEMDAEIARIKLRTMNVSIDELTKEQKKYMSGWEEGT
ncbi:MAG: adenosylhomocysteinase [Methanomassiliicoccaceae archaeon]|jgi:adenosylhomocysteinase|nr:adenosylhomocysteinase [Methanomassiliicoccaceae archaeon]